MLRQLEIYKPVFIIGSFRGGTSLLFRLLSESDELWSLYRESNHMWQPWHRDKRETADTVYLTDKDIKPGDREYFDKHYHFSAYDNSSLGELSRIRLLRNTLKPLFNLINIFNYAYKYLKLSIYESFLNTQPTERNSKNLTYRIIDKTPPNCFRIEYLAALYPEAKFIYITRNGLDNTSSLMNAWRSKKKFQFKYRKYLQERIAPLNIKGYEGDVWKFAMPEGWEKYINKTLAEVCAFQWFKTHEAALNSLEKLRAEQFTTIKFEDLMQNPKEEIKNLCDFLEIKLSPKMNEIIKEMPLVNTFSPASEKKSQKNQEELESIKDYIEPMQKKLEYERKQGKTLN